MNNPKTLKLLILAEAARIAELLEVIPESQVGYTCGYSKEKAELKAKLAELRRDSIALQKVLNGVDNQ